MGAKMLRGNGPLALNTVHAFK